ncbi:MAG: hypothetical protein R3C61_04710 [Bacteroidia bacterium]
MKPIIPVILISFSFLSCAAQKPAARLIVRGDDIGYAHSGNIAITEILWEGFQSSYQFARPLSWFPEAVRMLKKIRH